MTTLKLATTILASLLCAFVTQGAPPHAIERGKSIAIEVQFKAAAHVNAANLTWQTFGEVKAKQSGMKRGFACVADVARVSSDVVAFTCKVPLTVADGHYVLTSISVETDDVKREYSFTKDLPVDIYADIKGGPELTVADLKSLALK